MHKVDGSNRSTSSDVGHKLLPEGRKLFGRAKLKKAVVVAQCEAECLPRYLYRAVHDGYHEGGMRARGAGSKILNSTNFQIYLEYHLIWSSWHIQSPFLSVTNDIRKADSLCRGLFMEQGRKDFRILVIDTEHVSWKEDHAVLWNANDLKTVFDLRKEVWNTSSEFLLEEAIPSNCVVETLKWDPANFEQWTSRVDWYAVQCTS
jgi:hypothetical protein